MNPATLTPAEYRAAVAAPKASKFRNVKTEVAGVRYDSRKEANRGVQLGVLERAGKIFDLKRQVVFPLDVNGHSICRYVCDFQYVDENGRRVVEDVKSKHTRTLREYAIKRKLMLAIHGVEIVET